MGLGDRGEDGREEARGYRRARRHSPVDDEIAAFIDDLLSGRGRDVAELRALAGMAGYFAVQCLVDETGRVIRKW